MQIRERLSLLLLFSTFFILCVLNFDSSDPGRGRAIRPQPIQATFAKIRTGMTEEELDDLMAPYQEVDTGHLQWRYWRERGTVVLVTVWPNNFRPILPPGLQPTDGPSVVQGKEMHKESLKQRQNY